MLLIPLRLATASPSGRHNDEAADAWQMAHRADRRKPAMQARVLRAEAR
jgi:hypothetical protein